ncbi:MAG: hypothetical protein ACTHK5_06625 [Tsuneonella sp.]
MNPIAALLAPLALLLPAAAELVSPDDTAQLTAREDMPSGPVSEARWLPFDAPNEVPVYDQVRIEQHLTIRIVPRSPVMRESLMADLPHAPIMPRMSERKMGKCVPVGAIAGFQTGPGSQLVLFMRDQRVVSANLEKACSARDFYAGFYLEHSPDGMLCVDRDKLLSRNGVQCHVSRLRLLVQDED